MGRGESFHLSYSFLLPCLLYGHLNFLLLPLLVLQVQKQNMLSLTSKDLQSMWEEQFKSRSNLEERVAQLDREKADLFEQVNSENSPET